MSTEALNRKRITNDQYRALAEFRYHIRCYLNLGDRAARTAGIEPRQYQLLLAIKGLPRNSSPTVSTLAEQLQVRHHSAVELIIRAERRGLVSRRRSPKKASNVLVELTSKGEQMLRKVAAIRLEELQIDGPHLVRTLRKLI